MPLARCWLRLAVDSTTGLARFGSRRPFRSWKGVTHTVPPGTKRAGLVDAASVGCQRAWSSGEEAAPLHPALVTYKILYTSGLWSTRKVRK